jgi:SAM-dependent methyltransferase
MSSESATFHCWYCANMTEALEKGRYLLEKFETYFRGPIVDLGCGEGAMLLALKEKGRTDLLGIESNPELAGLAESWGVPVVRTDLGEFIRGELGRATYTYIDVIEHLPFELNVDVLKSIPAGSRLILQTPYTDSLLGHQSYMNVPSHVAPYSPMVVRQMLAKLRYEIVAEGSVDGRHPDGWKKKLRGIFVKRVLGLPVELITGGANYFVVADR